MLKRNSVLLRRVSNTGILKGTLCATYIDQDSSKDFVLLI